MECERAAELLPWLRSGTLDVGERDEVRTHLASCSRCRSDFSEAGFAVTVHTEHLPAETIVDYAFDRLGPEREFAGRHLSVCPDCAELLELARESRSLELGDPDVVIPLPNRGLRWFDAVLAACLALSLGFGAWFYMKWQEDRALVASAAAREHDIAEQLASLEQERARDEAALSRVGELESEIERLRNLEAPPVRPTPTPAHVRPAPELNVPTYDLTPSEQVERSEAEMNDIELPANARSCVFILGSQSGPVDSPLSLRVADERGRIIWRGRGLRRHTTNDYTVAIPTSLLTPGRYTLTIFAGHAAVEFYSLRVTRVTRQ